MTRYVQGLDPVAGWPFKGMDFTGKPESSFDLWDGT